MWHESAAAAQYAACGAYCLETKPNPGSSSEENRFRASMSAVMRQLDVRAWNYLGYTSRYTCSASHQHCAAASRWVFERHRIDTARRSFGARGSWFAGRRLIDSQTSHLWRTAPAKHEAALQRKRSIQQPQQQRQFSPSDLLAISV